MSLVDQIHIRNGGDYDAYEGDDDRYTFRVNKRLKEDFSRVCRRDRIPASVAIKRYMVLSVRAGKLK